MKRFYLVVGLLIAGALCLGASMTTLDTSGLVPSISRNTQAPVTSQYDWMLMRTVTASDSALTATTKAWTTIESKFYRVPPGYNYVELACYADGDGTGTGDPNSGSFSWKVFVCQRNSSAKLVGTGTWAIGELALSHQPYNTTETALTYGITDPDSSKVAELPVVTTDEWGGLIAGGAANDWGTLRFDARGSYGVFVEVTSLANCTNLYVLCRGF